jgi:hypothetical protein
MNGKIARARARPQESAKGSTGFSLTVANQSPGVTVVADAGMISGANQGAVEAVGCRSSSA